MRSAVSCCARLASRRTAFVHLLGWSMCIVGCGPHETDSPEVWRNVRHIGYDHAFDGADVLVTHDHTWTASVDSPAAVVPRIVLRREPKPRAGVQSDPAAAVIVGTIVGTAPSVVLLDEDIGMLYRSATHAGHSILLFRRFAPQSGKWSRPTRVDAERDDHVVANGRLVRNDDGSLLVTVVCTAAGRRDAVELCTSSNRGRSWRVQSTSLSGVSLPAVAPSAAGLILVGNERGELVRSVSPDAGKSWSPPTPMQISAMKAPHALRPVGPGALMLVWTEPLPGREHAEPAIQSLLCARSIDAGETWGQPVRLVTRPGIVPVAPALAASEENVALLFEERGPARQDQDCLTLDHSGFLAMDRPGRSDLQLAADSGIDPGVLREALCILTAHTLARPQRAPELFIESYFMRAVVHAHEALAPFDAEHRTWLNTEPALQKAIAFADSQVAMQGRTGYWSIGYGTMFVADMATLVGLFRSLEPHVDADRLHRYVGAVERFVAGLQRDQMLLPSGGVGGGFAAAARNAELRRPFLVATALAGVEAQAWLFSQTRDERRREAARRSLQFILDHIETDGSIAGYAGETPLWSAAYVQEGFIAADRLLDDPGLVAVMRPALARHVDWVLGFQQPDGSWDTRDPGERLRTNLIVNFLIWYYERVDPRPDVRTAIQRSMPSFTYDWWNERHFYDEDAAVLRALSGVPLVALNQGRAVF